MKALLIKETRGILPYLAIALLLAVVPVWLVGWPWRDWSSCLIALVAGVSLLCVVPFGLESTHGTFSLLLSQPVPRERLWKMKAGTLAAPLTLVVIAFCVSLSLRFVGVSTEFDPFHELPRLSAIAALIGLAGFAGGMLYPLILRQFGAAIWFIPLIPGLLATAVLAVLDYLAPGRTGIAPYAAMIILYAAVAIRASWRLFGSAQDCGWTGGVVDLQALWGRKAKTGTGMGARRWKPWAALVRHELALHQVGFLILGVALLLHSLALTLHTGVNIPWKGAPLAFYMFAWFLWFAAALVFGAVAIAEERRLGMEAGHLILPIAWWKRFLVKLGIVLTLTLAGCTGLPTVIEALGLLTGRSTGFFEMGGRVDLGVGAWNLAGVALLATSTVLVAMVAFHASSIARNTTEALGGSAAAGLGIMSLAILRARYNDHVGFEWGLLTEVVTWAVMLPVAAGLTLRNYRHLHEGRRTWLRNLAVIAAAMGAIPVITAGAYNRVWEPLLPVSPRQDAARIPTTGTTRLVFAYPGMLFAVLPDGRLWASPQSLANSWVRRLNQRERGFPETDSGFLDGSDWVDLASSGNEVLGLRRDGTPWRIFRYDGGTGTPILKLEQLDGSRWISIAGDSHHFVGVREDGSLWGWGADKLCPPTVPAPARIGTDSDWMVCFADGNHALAQKRDLSLWKWGSWGFGAKGVWENKSYPLPLRWIPDIEFTGAVRMGGGNAADIILRPDGTLLFASGNLDPADPHIRTGQLAEGKVWREVDLYAGGFAGITSDGELWKGRLNAQGGECDLTPSRVSERTDWLAVTSTYSMIFALASDGDLCCWWSDSDENHGLLRGSRRYLGTINILDEK